MLTKSVLKKLWPRAPQSMIDGVVTSAPRVFGAYGLTTPLRIAHFMAQISHESAGGTVVRENMDYSASRLLEVFGIGKHSAAVTPTEAAQLAHHPEAIANRVYGIGNPKKARELGNVDSNDGWLYRGGGLLQLTGRDNYRKFGLIAGIDLESDPDKIADPATSLLVAAAEFKSLGCLPYCDKDDVRQVTRRVNGGTNGLASREDWLKRWKTALPNLPDQEASEDEPHAVPRGAESSGLAGTIKSSKIAKTAISGGAAIAAAGAKQAVDAHSAALDSVIGAPYYHEMAVIGAVVMAIAIVATIAIVYWRHRDHS